MSSDLIDALKFINTIRDNFAQQYAKAVSDFDELYKKHVKNFEDTLDGFMKTGEVPEPQPADTPAEAQDKTT